jgi:hypothetical protein
MAGIYSTLGTAKAIYPGTWWALRIQGFSLLAHLAAAPPGVTRRHPAVPEFMR